MKTIRDKYKKLEEELVKSRTATQSDMVAFMDDNVGKALSDLTNHRMRIDARLKQSCEVMCSLRGTHTSEECR